MSITFSPLVWSKRFDCYSMASDDLPDDAPQANFSNRNVLELCGLPVDYHGEVEGTELSDLQQNIMRALNVDSRRKHYRRESVVHDEPGQATMIEGGVTDESLRRRLSYLQEVVVYCVEHDLKLGWG